LYSTKFWLFSEGLGKTKKLKTKFMLLLFYEVGDLNDGMTIR